MVSERDLITNDTKYYLYDQSNRLIAIKYNGNSYYYIRELTGNIIGLIDDSGVVVVEYEYDAFGNVINITGSHKESIGKINPFIYKGYYYDFESTMYYCKTRYYVPEWCRWLNADSVDYLNPESINGLNLYNYCGNNPIMRIDPYGNAWYHWVIGGAIIGGLIVATILTGGAALPALMLGGSILLGGAGAITAAVNGTDIGAGFMTGVLLGAAAGAVLSMGAPAILAGVKSVGDKFISDMVAYATYGKPFGGWETYVIAFAFSGLTSGLGFNKIDSTLMNIFLRPAVDQFVGLGMRGKPLNGDKYKFDVVNRALTEFLPTPIKPVIRGLNSGWYDANKNKVKFIWQF